MQLGGLQFPTLLQGVQQVIGHLDAVQGSSRGCRVAGVEQQGGKVTLKLENGASATGDVLVDQLQMLQRCGFSQAVLRADQSVEAGQRQLARYGSFYQGDAIEIGFQPAFIIDALKVVDGQQVMVEMRSPQKPGVFKVGQEFTYVVMPVNVG